MIKSHFGIRVIAAVGTIVLAGIVLWIISRGRSSRLANGKQVSLLQASIMDKDTSTYSLAKVQLYVWLFAAVAVYLYLLAAWVLAQGKFELVDVPQNIVALALISISTTVVSSGIASLSGGKGSGPFDPTPADLISSGGEVAAERVQQLIWTVVAAPAFVVFAYMLPPDNLNPDSIAAVPEHFLQLMGLSSTGYLAGKLARGPGPKITSLAPSLVTGPPPFLTLSVRGSSIQTRGAAFTLRDLAMPDAKDIPLPVTPLPSSTIDSSGVATALDLSVLPPGCASPRPGIRGNTPLR